MMIKGGMFRLAVLIHAHSRLGWQWVRSSLGQVWHYSNMYRLVLFVPIPSFNHVGYGLSSVDGRMEKTGST